MADPQYLSTDPAAGQYLSSDPSAGEPLAKAPHPEAKISAAAPGQVKALPPDAVDQFGIQKGVGPKTSQMLTSPLIHPTGSDAIDSIFSPASLALMAATAGPSIVKAATGAVSNLTDAVGGKIAARLIKSVTPQILKAPAEWVGILSDLAEAYKGKAAPAEAPATPQAAPTAPQAQTPTPAPVASPAPTSPSAAAPDAVSVPAAPMSTPDAFKSALKAFADAKEVPRPAEVNNVQMLIKRGVAPDTALQTVLGNRPPNPAAELAKRLGTPSEAEMNADMAARARKGQKSLMPKYGGDAPAASETSSTPTATSTEAIDWRDKVSQLQSQKPSSIAKYFGTNGPTPEGLQEYNAQLKQWNQQMRVAKQQLALQHEAEASVFAAKNEPFLKESQSHSLIGRDADLYQQFRRLGDSPEEAMQGVQANRK